MKQELIPWLGTSRRTTQRFARAIGRQCKEMSIARVAEMHQLDWGQVRRLEMEYMKDLMAKHPTSKRLRAIGIDEVSIKKGHTYAIVVADLDQQRPIWMHGPGRSQEEMEVFFKDIGQRRCRSIQMVVMDMWQPFKNSVTEHAPEAEIIYDKFHVIKHLSAALDEVRRMEYKRVSLKDRRFIKGQRYTLLSNQANLTLESRRSLKLLLKANKRLNSAYILKESFGQL